MRFVVSIVFPFLSSRSDGNSRYILGDGEWALCVQTDLNIRYRTAYSANEDKFEIQQICCRAYCGFANLPTIFISKWENGFPKSLFALQISQKWPKMGHMELSARTTHVQRRRCVCVCVCGTGRDAPKHFAHSIGMPNISALISLLLWIPFLHSTHAVVHE